jgi:aspartate racemase
MTARSRPIVGILGGMGPEATIDLMRRVVTATPARDDRDHIHMLVDSNPDVPSRIAALIEGTGESPAAELARMGKRLQAGGAEILAIACNTAHAYAPDIRAEIDIPLLDMIELTAGAIASMALARRRVGLLASTAVVNIGLYEKALLKYGVASVVPRRQGDLMTVIKAIKRGETGELTRQAFAGIADELMNDSVDLLLIACTELSVIADSVGPELPCLDALDVLSQEIVRCGRGAIANQSGEAKLISHR